jgi:hypothetical protein
MPHMPGVQQVGPSDAAMAQLEVTLTEAVNAAVDANVSDEEFVKFIGVRLLMLGNSAAPGEQS